MKAEGSGWGTYRDGILRTYMKRLIKGPFRALGLDLVRTIKMSASDRDAISYPSTDWLSEYNVRTVLDIGANNGDFALTMGRRLPNADIYSFEPLKDAYARLRENTSKSPRHRTFNVALGNVNDELQIHKSAYSPSSSILPMTDLHRRAFPISAGDDGIEAINVRRLDDMAAELEIVDDVFIKIDVQGFEADVIRGGRATLKRAKSIIVETSFEPLYEGQPLFDDIYGIMRDLGFVYSGNWDQLVNPQSGRILQADAIFRPASAS